MATLLEYWWETGSPPLCWNGPRINCGWVRMAANAWSRSLKRRGESQSSPAALMAFSFLNIVWTPFMVTVEKYWMICWVYFWCLGVGRVEYWGVLFIQDWAFTMASNTWTTSWDLKGSTEHGCFFLLFMNDHSFLDLPVGTSRALGSLSSFSTSSV